MKWRRESNYHYYSDKGYKVTAFIIEGKTIFRAFAPDNYSDLPQAIGSTYSTSKQAKQACEKYQIEVSEQ